MKSSGKLALVEGVGATTVHLSTRPYREFVGQFAVGRVILWAGVISLEHIALEPYVRRLGAAAFLFTWNTNLYLGSGDGTAWSAVLVGLCVTFFVTVAHRVGLLAGPTSLFW